MRWTINNQKMTLLSTAGLMPSALYVLARASKLVCVKVCMKWHLYQHVLHDRQVLTWKWALKTNGQPDTSTRNLTSCVAAANVPLWLFVVERMWPTLLSVYPVGTRCKQCLNHTEAGTGITESTTEGRVTSVFPWHSCTISNTPYAEILNTTQHFWCKNGKTGSFGLC